MIKKVHTDNAPQAIGPYSQAIICGNMLFTSGQIAINPATGEFVEKVEIFIVYCFILCVFHY